MLFPKLGGLPKSAGLLPLALWKTAQPMSTRRINMSHKVKPWMPFNVEWWPAVAANLTKPWPPEAVSADLRWWADQESVGRAKRPSRRSLQKRWGLSDHHTRTAMRDSNTWEKSEISQGPPKDLPKISQRSPKIDTQTIETTRGALPGSSQTPPNVLPTISSRAELQTTHYKQHTTENKTIMSDSLKAIRQLWTELNTFRSSLDSKAKELKLTKSRESAIRGRIKEHSADDVVTVVKWWLTSQHQRAQYLRDNGYGIDTILRASKFATYLEAASAPTPSGPQNKQPVSGIALLAEVRRKREEKERDGVREKDGGSFWDSDGLIIPIAEVL